MLRPFQKELTMKTLRTLLSALLLIGAASIHAQADDQAILKATVPFDFTVANTTLPAGTYSVSVLTPDNIVRLQGTDGHSAAFVYSTPLSIAGGTKDTRLVFQHLGSKYFLSQIWEQGNEVRREVSTGNLARELAKDGNGDADSRHSKTVYIGSDSN